MFKSLKTGVFVLTLALTAAFMSPAQASDPDASSKTAVHVARAVVKVFDTVPGVHVKQRKANNGWGVVGPDGIPNQWCNNHAKLCATIRTKAATNAAAMALRGDTFKYDTGPKGWRGKVNSLLTVNPKAPKDNGGYGDWAGPADCTSHGYACYPTANTRTELSDAEKVLLWCAGTVVATAVTAPSGATSAEIAGAAGERCMWGAAGFFGWLWGN